MPQYGRYDLASSTPTTHRFFVLIEELHDVLVEVRRVDRLDARQPLFVDVDNLDLKPRFFRLIIAHDHLRVTSLIRTILPEELAAARHGILTSLNRLLETASDHDHAVAAITARRPKLDEPREVSLTPRVAKVWDYLQALHERQGIRHCRAALRQHYGAFADQAFSVLTDVNLVWAHPLTDLAFIARRVKIRVKQPLNV